MMTFLHPVLRRILAALFAVLFVLAAVVYLPHAAGYGALLAVALLLPVPAWQQALERVLKKAKPLVIVAVALSVFLAAPTDREPPQPAPLSPTQTTVMTARTTKTTTEQETTYILNVSSKKFHLPHCANAQKIKDENRRTVTGTKSSLKADGYSPCGNCLP